MDNLKYKIIQTGDGTVSLFSDEYQEAMHSVSGAYEEALKKHVYPSRIMDIEKKELRVLDVGFGMGYNTLALIYQFKKSKSGIRLDIVSFEKDRSYIAPLEKVKFSDSREEIYDSLKIAYKTGSFQCSDYAISIVFGDARKSIGSLHDENFDAVFHDPYSPSKNPELWTVEFFSMICARMLDHCVLTTYSSAPQVRAALIDAELRIGSGPAVGKKREGTIASRGADIEYFCNDDLEAFKKNVKFTPYRDPGLCASRKEILAERIEKMRLLRSIQSRQALQQ